MFLRKILKLFLLFFLLVNTNISNAQEKIFYINLDYIMNNSLAGKSITDQLKEMNELNLKNFQKTEKNLQTDESKIIAQKNVLSKEEYQKQINLLREKILKYRNTRKDTTDLFNTKKLKAQSLLVETITPIIADYSKQNSISLILPKKNIIIGKKELDITFIILKFLNEKIKIIKLN